MTNSEIIALTMPKWGMSMVTGKVTGWLVDEGESVVSGDEVVEVETDKIAGVVEAADAGTLRRQVAGIGDSLAIGALLGVIAPEAVTDAEIDAFIAAFQDSYTPPEADEAEAGPTTAFAEVDGLRLAYLDRGEGDDPIVLIHGFGGDLNSWLFNQPVLASERRVIALDLPGHGQSEKRVPEGGVPALANTVLGLLDELGLARAHFVGHSLGGVVAAMCALKRPGGAASLTLVASGGLGEEIDADYISAFIAANRRKEIKPLLARLFADGSLVGREMINEVLKYKRLEGVEEALRTIEGATFAGGKQSGTLIAPLKGLDVPIQVIWGAQDRIIPVAHANALGDKTPVHVIEGAGHMVHMEAAAEVNRLIGNFVAAH